MLSVAETLFVLAVIGVVGMILWGTFVTKEDDE